MKKGEALTETVFHDFIEEYQTEDIIAPANRSVNHSRTMQRIRSYLERYDDRYVIFPELEMKLDGKP